MPTQTAAPTEYCLFWIDHWAFCMQKGEWSGWAQAVGALLALALAIGLPIKARADARREAKQSAVAYATQMLIALDRLQKSCVYQSWSDFSARREAFSQTVQLANGIPIALLDSDTTTCVMALRSATIEIFRLSENHTSGGNWQHWENVLKQSHNACREVFDKMLT